MKGEWSVEETCNCDPTIVDHSVGCTPLTIVGGSDSLGVLLPQIIRRGWSPRAVVDTLFGRPPVRTGSASPLIRWGTAPSPSFPIIPVISLPISLPISVIETVPLTFTATARAAGPVTGPISGRWGPPIPVVAPNRRRRVLGPLEW